jgi:hypothetical protein
MRAVARSIVPVALAVVLVQPGTAAAHRLDEYLQATRIAVNVDSVDLDIDLTAGVEVAPKVWALVDADGNGKASEAEAETYSNTLLAAMSLRVDDRPCKIGLVASRFPTQADLMSGSGPIHVQARAALRPTAPGPHRLLFRNTHQPQLSVYLVNALVPLNRAITITSQRRDPKQTQLTMAYTIAGH